MGRGITDPMASVRLTKRGGQSISPPSLNRLEGNYPLVKHSDLEFGSWSPSSRADSAGQVPPLENADNS